MTDPEMVHHWNRVMSQVLAGSEYHNSPEAYVARFRQQGDTVKAQAKRIAELTATVEGMRRALEANSWDRVVPTGYGEILRWYCAECLHGTGTDVCKTPKEVTHANTCNWGAVRAALSAPGVEAVRREWERLKREMDNWIETSKFHAKNERFYRRIVVKIGEMFGEDARRQDDGNLNDDVLILRVPECVEALHQRAETAEAELARLRPIQSAAEKMIDELDNATGADDWSTSELRAAINAAREADRG